MDQIHKTKPNNSNNTNRSNVGMGRGGLQLPGTPRGRRTQVHKCKHSNLLKRHKVDKPVKPQTSSTNNLPHNTNKLQEPNK